MEMAFLGKNTIEVRTVETRYDSALFGPLDDMGLLEGMVLKTLADLGIDREGLSMFRRAFEEQRDAYLQARDNNDAEQIDHMVKEALKYVPKYAKLETLNTDINLNPEEWVAYHQEHGTDRNMPGELH